MCRVDGDGAPGGSREGANRIALRSVCVDRTRRKKGRDEGVLVIPFYQMCNKYIVTKRGSQMCLELQNVSTIFIYR